MPGQPDRWAGHREPRNHLLEMFSPQDWASVEPLLERVELAVSETLELSGEVSPWLHFPESAIISVVTTLADGRRVEVGTVGNEGMCGLSPGTKRSPMTATPSAACRARVCAAALRT